MPRYLLPDCASSASARYWFYMIPELLPAVALAQTLGAGRAGQALAAAGAGFAARAAAGTAACGEWCSRSFYRGVGGDRCGDGDARGVDLDQRDSSEII